MTTNKGHESGTSGPGAISRRQFVKSMAVGATMAPTMLTRAPRKRNVLFMASDDLCTRIGCYGNPVARTPNLDRLARAGVRFDRAYCQYPLCSPSRSSLMTGRAPDTTRVWGNQNRFREALPDVVTLPQAFQRNGYFVARAGKIYHYNNPSEIGTPGLDDPASWQETSNPAGVDRIRDEALVDIIPFNGRGTAPRAGRAGGRSGGTAARGRGRGGVRISQDGVTPILPLSANGDLGITLAIHRSEWDDELHTESMVADAAIAMMEKHRSDPWFLASGFFKPHVPWIVPSKYFDLFPLDGIDVPPFSSSEMTVAPHWAYTSVNPNGGMTARQHREAMQAYYAAMAFMDAQVGRLLDAVDRLGLTRDTTTVFWADHGWQLGEHGQWQKMTLFEPSARVPLFIGGAGVAGAGRACGRTVEHLDIYPTLVDLCDLRDVPSGLQGQSLAPLLEDPAAPWDRPALSQVSRRAGQGQSVMGYSIRTERYRYTSWNRGTEGEELYDYENDPRELRNLASESGAAELKTRLRTRLEAIAKTRGMAS